MTSGHRLGLALLAVATGAAAGAAPAGAGGEPAADAPLVLAYRFDADVNPVSARYVEESLDEAADRDADAVVLLLDTPGGLVSSMDDIVQDVLESPVPVIVYVSPAGARAGSAGVFITQAADVAAMAPNTNIGSATPISSSGQDIGDDLRRKAINDAAAKIRALARSHGRNAAVAEATVRRATNYTAEEALDNGLVDQVAESLPDLLAAVDGTRTTYKGIVLHTAGAEIEEHNMPLTLRVLLVLVNPNLLFVLFLAGIAGIGYEVIHPGAVLPGSLGAIALLLALFGFSAVPINEAGAVLLALGVALIVAEAFVTSGGVLAAGGIAALAVGGLMLFRVEDAEGVSPALVIGIAVALGGGMAAVGTKVVAARRRPPSALGAGSAGLVGQTAVVRTPLDPRGQVFVHGELWQAEVGDGAVPPGERVVVESVQGLTLRVAPIATRGPAEPTEMEAPWKH